VKIKVYKEKKMRRSLWIILWLTALVLSGCQNSSPYAISTQVIPYKTEEGATISPTSRVEITKTVTPGVGENPSIGGSEGDDKGTQVITNTTTTTIEPNILMKSSTLNISGIEMHEINPIGGLNLVVGADAAWIRRNALFWSDVEPNSGDRNWEALAKLEEELINASKAGLETVLVVRRTPTWAQKYPGVFCGPIKPDALDAFAKFMGEVVERYSKPPYNVIYWEIANEPDIDPKLVPPDEIFGCWGDDQEPFYGGEYYAEMLKLAYPEIKAANSRAQVLIGGLVLDCDPEKPPLIEGTNELKVCAPALFFEGILKNSGGNFFDGVSFHAYDYYLGAEGKYENDNWASSWDKNGPVMINKVSYIRDLLQSYGYPNKFIINSELGLICGNTGEEPECRTEAFENTKAYFVAQTYATAKALGLRSNIWYSIHGWRASGLANMANTPTKALSAFETSARILSGSTLNRILEGYPQIMGFEFIKNDIVYWVLWAMDSDPQYIQLADPPKAIYDIFGNPLKTQREIGVSLSPIYVEFP
jgi:hypothetical protein